MTREFQENETIALISNQHNTAVNYHFWTELSTIYAVHHAVKCSGADKQSHCDLHFYRPNLKRNKKNEKNNSKSYWLYVCGIDNPTFEIILCWCS